MQSRDYKRLVAGIGGSTTYYLMGGFDFPLNLRQAAINGGEEMVDYIAKKVNNLDPSDLVKLLSSPDDTQIPGTGITLGQFKQAYETGCTNLGCTNLLGTLIDACRSKSVISLVIDVDTMERTPDLKVGEVAQGVLYDMIRLFKQQLLAIANGGKPLIKPMVDFYYDTPIGQNAVKVLEGGTKIATMVVSGAIFLGAEKLHDRIHGHENSMFAYLLCGIVSGGAAVKIEQQLAQALSLFSTGQAALSTGVLAFAIPALDFFLQFSIRELDERMPAIRQGVGVVVNTTAAFLNNAAGNAAVFFNNNRRLLMPAAVAIGVGVGATVYCNSKK